jgi:thiosulfate/3-mercaptopyruvate sulfurtransferase
MKVRNQSHNQSLLFFFTLLCVIGFTRHLHVYGQTSPFEVGRATDSRLAKTNRPSAIPAYYADDPWKHDELMQPADLARSLAAKQKPMILQIGVIHLYRLGHIPGAIYAGQAGTAEGLETLKKALQDRSRTSEIVFYCGCCPMPDCPNIRPAYQALRELGFKQIKLLNLPNNFTQDWQMKGFPVEKGGA